MPDPSTGKVPETSSQGRILQISGKRIEQRIMELARYTDPKLKGYTRLAFSQEDRLAREAVRKFMEDAGLKVRVDPAGNIIGKRDGKQANAPVILAGSHIDTVMDGGRFDGVTGVVSAIEAAESFRQANLVTQHPIEIVVFTSEEPGQFGISTIGSRAMTGKLDKQLLLALTKGGLTLGEAIDSVGGNAGDIDRAARKGGDILAYLELHIEQGAVLDNLGIPIGVVTGIAGISRGQIIVVGHGDHAGTTPMSTRKDALVAAAEAIQSLEKVSRTRYPDETVATVGVIENFPNAANVIPGKVLMEMEIRSACPESLKLVEQDFRKELREIAVRRAIDISFNVVSGSPPVTMDDWTRRLIEESCLEHQIPYQPMVSGAGHDANHLAEITRAGMIFVPSKAGKSHCPEEWTAVEHIVLGTRVLAATILKIDQTAKEVGENAGESC